MFSEGIQSLRTPGFSRQTRGLSTDLCVCLRYFSSTQDSGSSGLAMDQESTFGDTSMGVVFGHWNESHTETLIQLPLHVCTYLNVHGCMHTHTHTHKPHFTAPQILIPFRDWAEVSMWASMMEGLSITSQKERLYL